MKREIRLWLTTPGAAERLDQTRLSASDRERRSRLRLPDRLAGWDASRALVDHVSVPAGAALSLSHTAAVAAVGVAAPGLRIGVDVETVRSRNATGLASLAFGPQEARQLGRMAPARAAAHFMLLWTLKEAFCKALGLSLATALRECRFELVGRELRALIPAAQGWWAVAYAPRETLVFAAAVIDDAGGDPPAWTCAEWPEAARRQWPQLVCLSRATNQARLAWPQQRIPV